MSGIGRFHVGATRQWCVQSVVELLNQFRRGTTDPVAVVDALLQTVDEHDNIIQAFTHVDSDRARQQARLSSDRYLNGSALPLDGLPVAIKEVIAVDAMPFTGQSRTREGVVADCDAEIVAQLRRLGAVIVGMTRTSELACGVTTQNDGVGTRNPRNQKFIAGGSSGGSAAAVAAGYVPLALGTDTACSVRQPAACCGVVGFKPTHGLLPTSGVIPAVPQHDVVGLIANSVVDISYVLQALDLIVDTPKVARLGIVNTDRLSIEQEQSLQNATTAAEANGLQLVNVNWPLNANIRDAMRVIAWYETLRTHRDVLGTWPDAADLYSANIRDFLASSESITDSELTVANNILKPAIEAWGAALDEVDAVMLPTMSGPPSQFDLPDFVEIDDVQYSFRDSVIPWNLPINILGVAACAIPAGKVFFQSVQIAGRNDNAVLDIATKIHISVIESREVSVK